MSIQNNINSIIGSLGTAAYLIKDLKFKKDVSEQMSKYVEKDTDTGSQSVSFKPKGTPDTWTKGNAPVGGGGQVFQPGQTQTAEIQAALKNLKKRQMQLRNIETGNWEDIR